MVINKIVCISDTHALHTKLRIHDCDLLIHAGDHSSTGNIRESFNFLNWFSHQPARHKVMIAGNHDFSFQKNDMRAYVPSNVTYLENEVIKIEDLVIFGSPWTPYFYDWAFNGTDEEQGDRLGPNLNKLWSECPENVDIMITHGPPYQILDKNREGQSCGSKMLLKHLERIQPRFNICGHIHEGRGSHEIKWQSGRSTTTLVYNVASVGREYGNNELMSNPIVIWI